MATDDILRFEDVVAGYGRETILRGLSFDVRRGAITTVIGPNGSGKSTAFKASFGMLPVRSGRIFYDGQDITNHTPRQLIARRHLLRAARAQHLSRIVRAAQSRARRRRRAQGFDLEAAHGSGDGPLPGAAPQGPSAGLDTLRRRAEDAGNRPRPDAATEIDADRRALDRTVADPGGGAVRADRGYAGRAASPC